MFAVCEPTERPDDDPPLHRFRLEMTDDDFAAAGRAELARMKANLPPQDLPDPEPATEADAQ